MNKERLNECIGLSAEILRNFEYSEIPLRNIVLKCLRLCRLLGDEDGVLLFSYESSGYGNNSEGLTPDAWRIADIAGRRYFRTDPNNSAKKEYANVQVIGEIEETIATKKMQLENASDPNVSISSANPRQNIMVPLGNTLERNKLVKDISDLQRWLQVISGHLYNYILQIYNRLKYGNIIEDTFADARIKANKKLADLCPESIGKFIAVYDNMDSNNPEDWANAVHSCRRILLDLADVLYPARDTSVTLSDGKTIKVGKEQYINRLIQFIESRKGSRTYSEIVGSDLSSIGQRLDAIYNASNKGTHYQVEKSEAARYIIHTYLLISDIVDLV